MLVALAFYTAEIIFMNIVASAKSNLLPPGYLNHHVLTHAEINQRAYGSKITLVVEQCQCATIWILKICILIIYWRLTHRVFPKHSLAVIFLGGYVILTFIFMEGFYFGLWCKPFNQYWAVPTSNPEQCAAALHHLIVNMVFNLTSDLAMIAIALSLVLAFKFKKSNNLAVFGLILLGVFVVACAVANKAYSFSNPYGSQWTRWYIRESSTAVLVANLPFVWSLATYLKSTYKLRYNTNVDETGDFDGEATEDANDIESDNSERRGSTLPLTENSSTFEITNPAAKRSKLMQLGRRKRSSLVTGKEDQLAIELENWETPERPNLAHRQPSGGPYPEMPERSSHSYHRYSGYSETAESPCSPPSHAPPPYPERPSPSRSRPLSNADQRSVRSTRPDSPHPEMVDGVEMRLAIANLGSRRILAMYHRPSHPPPETAAERGRFLNPRPAPPIPSTPPFPSDASPAPLSHIAANDPFRNMHWSPASSRPHSMSVLSALGRDPTVTFSAFSTDSSEETQTAAIDVEHCSPDAIARGDDAPYLFPRAEDPNTDWYKNDDSS